MNGCLVAQEELEKTREALAAAKKGLSKAQWNTNRALTRLATTKQELALQTQRADKAERESQEWRHMASDSLLAFAKAADQAMTSSASSSADHLSRAEAFARATDQALARAANPAGGSASNSEEEYKPHII